MSTHSHSVESLTRLRRSQELSRGAGRVAHKNGMPWWTAWAWSCNQSGTTDLPVIKSLAREFLIGWRAEYLKANENKEPEAVTAQIGELI